MWGRHSLAPYFPRIQGPEPVGEVWFTDERNATSLGTSLSELIRQHPEILGEAANPAHPGLCPLLAKLIFTDERLSVQVHPDNEYAAKHHRTLGKTEAWHILDAHPTAQIALGFRETIQPERLRESALSGEIEHLLDWRSVQAGDTIYVPAGTVHAIGAGLTVCEIQQNSDITYRLYDYGRRRELHLDHACNVARVVRHDHPTVAVALEDWRDHLVDCSYFRIEKLSPKAPIRFDANLPHYLLLICLKGSGTIALQAFAPGEAWMVPAGAAEFHVDGIECEWLLAYASDQPASQIHAV